MVREFSDDQRSFCTQRKLQGATLAQIHQEYEHWWPMPTWGIVNPPPPSDRCLRLWVAKLNAKKTLQDLRKKRKSSREGVVSVCTPGVDSIAVSLFGNMTVERGEILIDTKE